MYFPIPFFKKPSLKVLESIGISNFLNSKTKIDVGHRPCIAPRYREPSLAPRYREPSLAPRYREPSLAPRYREPSLASRYRYLA